MKRIVLSICVFLSCAVLLFAQTVSSDITEENDSSGNELEASEFKANAQIAMSTQGYLVTAGDVYTLAYAAGTTPVSYTILVDTSYKIRVSNLGVLDASGKTFNELKTEVEKVVTKNYPMSGVQFVLLNPSVFTVSLTGEVKTTMEKKAWPLSRLSSVVQSALTPYSSIREVSIRSVNGKTATYDLFKARRYGNFSQDPYVRPGDVIAVKKFTRSVTITGSVKRPGTYQLLEGENFKVLVEQYADGFAPMADSSRMELTRYPEDALLAGEKVYLDVDDISSNFALQNIDVITVSAITELMPVMFVEGAIGATIGTNPESSTHVPVRFNQGENYANLVRRNKTWFSAVSDTQNAYILRGEEQIPVNLNPMLYDASYRSQYFVQEKDTLVIPFRQYFVTVSGAVYRPGRYPFIPDRDWSYYVDLAGGFVSTQNAREAIEITDITGKKLQKTDAISPETSIRAKSNSFTFYFNQYAPVITTVLSVATTVFTIIAVTSK